MLSFVIDALAVHRLTVLVTRDKVTEPLRKKVWERSDRLEKDANSGVSYLVTCPWCVSIYAAAGVVLARKVVPSLWNAVGSGLAMSSVAGFLEEHGG